MAPAAATAGAPWNFRGARFLAIRNALFPPGARHREGLSPGRRDPRRPRRRGALSKLVPSLRQVSTGFDGPAAELLLGARGEAPGHPAPGRMPHRRKAVERRRHDELLEPLPDQLRLPRRPPANARPSATTSCFARWRRGARAAPRGTRRRPFFAFFEPQSFLHASRDDRAQAVHGHQARAEHGARPSRSRPPGLLGGHHRFQRPDVRDVLARQRQAAKAREAGPHSALVRAPSVALLAVEAARDLADLLDRAVGPSPGSRAGSSRRGCRPHRRRR